MTAADRLTVPAALAIAEAALAVERPGEVILGAWYDADGIAVAHGHAEDIIAIGEGPLLIHRLTGEVAFLGSLAMHERLGRMRTVRGI